MNLPLFYQRYLPEEDQFELEEEAARHAVQVLRLKEQDALLLTDGKGNLAESSLVKADKKKSTVRVTNRQFVPRSEPLITLAISLIKNAARFEWLVEKVTELGIHRIVPLQCHRTEKLQFKPLRIQNILVSAMLQSRQYWLPVVDDPMTFSACLSSVSPQSLKLIAHCHEDNRVPLSSCLKRETTDVMLFVGPEGDFTAEELEEASRYSCKGITLGPTRLRTETAGMVGIALLKQLFLA